MSLIKIEIKSIFGNVLFSYEKENNTIKDTLCEANLRGANLRGADLRRANLRGADLYEAKNIEKTEWFNQCKQNILYIISHLPREVQGLRDKLINGEINGTKYEGDCCCLVGTLGKSNGLDEVCNIIPFYTKGLHNLGEQFFLQIREGDTPENSIFAKTAVELCDMILDKNK